LPLSLPLSSLSDYLLMATCLQLFKKKKEDATAGSGSVKSHDKHSQFKVVSNKRQSLLATTGHPAGWVNRTAEKDEEAVKGRDWRSEA
jgi:Protein of unknown function (DUF4449)